MTISYQPVHLFRGWQDAPEYFKSLLLKYSSKDILEVGSGANPTLSPDFVRENGLSYVTSDLNADELSKADPIYKRRILNLSDAKIDSDLPNSFDFVLSRMVGEHVRDGRQFHANVHKMLRPGGISAHCFSTMWALPFVVNRIMPDGLSARLLKNVAPRDEEQHGKFKAYYSWSRGPTKTMIKRFESLGFEVLEYVGYFGHHYYYKLPWLQRIEYEKMGLLLEYPVPLLCSYASLTLRKR